MRQILAALVALALACSPSTSPPTGERRVIALAPSIARIIQALGATDELVGVDEFSRRLPGLERIPSVGGLFAPDLERTIELRPTLVISVRSAQQHSYLAHLRGRGVRVEEVEPYTLAEHLANFEWIGSLIGRQAQGARLAERVRWEIEQVAEEARSLPARSVALILERDPLYVAGGGSFTHSLIEAAGGVNAFGDLEAPHPRVSLEVLAERAPDVLIDSTVGGDGGPQAVEEVRAYWGRFSWVRRVEPLDRRTVTLPGPDMASGARALLARVHPESAGPDAPRAAEVP